MNDTPEGLLGDILAYQEASADREAADLEARFGERVRALELRRLLDHVFRAASSSMLSVWLKSLRFAWQTASYATWLQVLRDLCDDRGAAIYDFLWFASESLALDIHRLNVPHPNLERELRQETYRDGGPHPMSVTLRSRMDDVFDYEPLWRRLADEGAPMRNLPPGSPDRHVLIV